MKKKILIVEDQFIEANNLKHILHRAGYEVCPIADSVEEALKIISGEKPDFVLLDIYLKGEKTGIDLAKILRERNMVFIYLSANSTKSTLDAAKETHPYGFLVKPFRDKDVLVMIEIARYMHENNLESMMRNKKGIPEKRRSELVENKGNNFHGIIGKSPQLQLVLKHLQIVAPTDTSILILGESGTGKERIAECIHELSHRQGKPLVKVNCAGLTATLIESTLFGHERGAYTGATEKRIGKFEQAQGGTIFLDEIGEMCLEVQLLRVLQEKEIERLGGNDTIKVDVRVIAATNRNLEKEVAAGKFRMDLYYRLNVFPITLPPLRERREDIALLANHFINYYSSKTGKSLESISPVLLAKLTNYSWPGNVRELSHTIERAVLLSQEDRISEIALPEFSLEKSISPGKVKTIEENERDHIIEVLHRCNGKIFGPGGAGELLGINPSTLNSRMKKLGIEKKRSLENQIDFLSPLLSSVLHNTLLMTNQ